MMLIKAQKVVMIVVLAIVAMTVYQSFKTTKLAPHPEQQFQKASIDSVEYVADVKPILETRCVACHSCYDAPCQLKLSSTDGILRGASKYPVYNSSRLKPVDTTRLFIDATSTEEWRQKGFTSVSERGDGDASILEGVLKLGRLHAFVANEVLPESVSLDINQKLSCPSSPTEFTQYAQEKPTGGMPYGMAALSEREYSVLTSWASQGALAVEPTRIFSAQMKTAIDDWEALLNGKTNKEKLSARYIYEHLFLAHLYFSDGDTKQFFRMVRSRTAPGKEIIQLGTRHPNSDPGAEPFYYRLRPITSTIVSKTHIVYPLSDNKLRRMRELFFDADWTVSALPGYARDKAENPFLTFAAIPPRSRYQFMLDDIRYTIMTFIRGPSCRGQTALNVIDDHFFVAFLDPDHDLSIRSQDFLERAKTLIKVPDQSASVLSIPKLWKKYYNSHRDYLAFREDAYFKDDPAGERVVLDALWPGNSYSPTSFLTVFRHFNSASVAHGFIGEPVKKLWVMDFPILERIYYNLVVDYDVFGNISHQLLSRLSMDYTRMESENLALDFMQREKRKAVRDGWYVGGAAQTSLYLAHSLSEKQRPSSIKYVEDDPVQELVGKLMQRYPEAVIKLNQDHPLAALSQSKGGFIKLMPDLSLVMIKGENKVYSLIRNKAHNNVAFIFGEDIRRTPDKDTMTVIDGFIGNYPNFYFNVSQESLERFATDLQAMTNPSDFKRIVETYGVRRTSPNFWAVSDWFNEQFRHQQPIESGVLDLNRYGNY